ncbi:hydroxyacid dehydrogenase [Phaeospirillum tilakii]|uniref:Hydroxyacid dehydrogenase n=1 Tax=Phaeospirillum tilakii TaxID=741673 RepID=A0ABW5C999_9PROT
MGDTDGKRARCLCLQPIHPAAVARLEAGGLAVITGPAEAVAPDGIVALVSRNAPVTAALLDRLGELRVVAKHGAGLDAIDLAAASARGICVVSTPGANALSVAEHAVALMLAVAKRIVPADRAVRAGDFGYKFRADFTELAGKRLGIVGLGASGRQLARIAGLGLGMRILASSPTTADAVFAACGAERRDLPALLAEADVISLHLPGRPDTRHLIGAAELALVKPGAILINTARGAVLDEAALVAALQDGRLGGAGLDVFEAEPLPAAHPLAGFDRVVLSPHVAGSTEAALERMGQAVAEQILDLLGGRRPAHLANPAVWTARQGERA